MNTQPEAMKLALEALEKIHNHPKSFWNCMNEITALRQAIEHAEQAQPVALEPLYRAAISCPHEIDRGQVTLFFDPKQDGHNALDQLSRRLNAASPPPRQPLTDEQFLDLILRTGTTELVGVATFVGGSIQMQGKIGLLRSAKVIKEFVEAAHGIKGEA